MMNNPKALAMLIKPEDLARLFGEVAEVMLAAGGDQDLAAELLLARLEEDHELTMIAATLGFPMALREVEKGIPRN